MKCYVTSAIAADQGCAKGFWRDAKVARDIGSSSCEDGLVFEEEKRVRDVSSGTLASKVSLKIPGVGVVEPT
jgi:hypothetical protein